MADVSAKDVAALRRATGAGMMDCKRALQDAGGEMAAAKDWLREHNLAGAAKRAGRSAQQGAIDVFAEGDCAALVELTCETDFVAKGADFKKLVASLVELVAVQGDEDLPGRVLGESTVGETIGRLSGTMGEKIELGRVARFESADGVLDAYRHVQNERGVIGVLIELGGVDKDDAGVHEVAHDVALHVANSAPRWLSREEVPQDEVDRERLVLEAQTRREGKPERALTKIVEGKLRGFFKSACLLDQPFVKDSKLTVGALVGNLGADACIRRFARVRIAED